MPSKGIRAKYPGMARPSETARTEKLGQLSKAPRSPGITIGEDFLYSFKAGLAAGGRAGTTRCGASGPRSAAVRALLGVVAARLTPDDHGSR